MKSLVLLITGLTLLFNIQFAFAEAEIGFPKSNIFIDSTSILEGESTNLYIILHKTVEAEPSVDIAIMDNDSILSTSTVKFYKNENLKIIKTKIKPEAGTHSFYARVQGSASTILNASVSRRTEEISFFVDSDTDGDGIGNIEDLDDDGDAIPDTEDEEPLVANEKKFFSDLIKRLTENKTASTSKNEKQIDYKTPGEITTILDETKKSNYSFASSSTVIKDTAAGFSNTFKKLENFRKNAAESINDYKVKELEKIKLIEDRTKKTPEEKISKKDASDLRSSQIASAAAAFTGAIFNHLTLFYIHIMILLYGLWRTIKHFLIKKFNIRHRRFD